ncbi:MAG: hypothetical protein ACI9KE_005393, partial [Polyangiales bacterium]
MVTLSMQGSPMQGSPAEREPVRLVVGEEHD